MTLTTARRTELAQAIAQTVANHEDFSTLSLDAAHAVAATELDDLTETIEMDDDEADLLWIEVKEAVAAHITNEMNGRANRMPLTADEHKALADMDESGALFLAEWLRLLYRRGEAQLAYAMECQSFRGSPMPQPAITSCINSLFREAIFA